MSWVFYPIAGDTLIVPFDTFDGGTGASITMTGLAVTDIEIYKDGSATTRASDNGYTLLDTDGIDRASTTGIHGFSIDLSDNSDSGFFTVGPWYEVWVSAVTIDGQTVNFIAAMFRIQSATRGMAGTALPDAAADAATGLPVSDAGGLDLDAMDASVINIENGVGIIVQDTADMQPRVVAIETDTGEIGTAGAGLSNISLPATGLDLILKGSTFALAIADSVCDEVLTGATHNITNSLGKRIRQIDAAFEVHSGTAQAGSTSTTIKLDTGADGTTDEIYAGDRCVIVAGTGAGEHGLIKTYAASTRIATMSKAWVITPDNTSEFVLVPADVDVEMWNDNTVTGDGDWAQVASDVAAILVDTAVIGAAGAGLTDLGGMNTGMKAEVLVEVNAAFDTAIAELGVAAPIATPTMRTAIMLVYMALRNKLIVQTSGTDALEIHNDAGAKICAGLVTDAAGDLTRAKLA